MRGMGRRGQGLSVTVGVRARCVSSQGPTPSGWSGARARAARVGLGFGFAAHLSELVAGALVGLEVLLEHDLPVGGGADAHEGPEDPDRDVEGEEEGGVVAREPPRNVQAHAREARAAKGEAVSLEVLAAATERVRRGRRRVRAAGSGGGVGRCAVEVGVVEGGRIGGPPNRESVWGGVGWRREGFGGLAPSSRTSCWS